MKPGVLRASADGWILSQTLGSEPWASQRDAGTSGGGTWPRDPGAWGLLGPAFLETRPLRFWFAVLAPPQALLSYLPAAT